MGSLGNQGSDTPALRRKVEGWARDNLEDAVTRWHTAEEARLLGLDPEEIGVIRFTMREGGAAQDIAIRRNAQGELVINGVSSVGGGEVRPPWAEVAAGEVHDALKRDPPWRRPE